jgi:glutamyl-tRNA reductase
MKGEIGKLNLIVKDYSELHIELQKADVVMVPPCSKSYCVDKF